jgi:hypothetical protein
MTGEIDALGLQNLIEDTVVLHALNEQEPDKAKHLTLKLSSVKTYLQQNNAHSVPLASKETLCRLINQGIKFPRTVRNQMLSSKDKEEAMFNRVILKFYDNVNQMVFQTAAQKLPLVQSICWVKNLINRWDGDLVDCIFQGTYMGRSASHAGAHRVKIFEDGEDLQDVLEKEIILSEDLHLKSGDTVSCSNPKRDGWGDEIYSGIILELVKGGSARKMVVDFGDEICNDIVINEIYHIKHAE